MGLWISGHMQVITGACEGQKCWVPPETGVVGSYEPFLEGVVNQIQVICKSSLHS